METTTTRKGEYTIGTNVAIVDYKLEQTREANWFAFYIKLNDGDCWDYIEDICQSLEHHYNINIDETATMVDALNYLFEGETLNY